MDDTLWLLLIVIGVGGLSIGLSLLVMLNSDRQLRKRRWERNRSRTNILARDR